VPQDWKGTVFDILDCEKLSYFDRFWLVVRLQIMESQDIHLFALRCAQRVVHLMTDDRSRNALLVVERYLKGDATWVQVNVAEFIAESIAISTCEPAAWVATWTVNSAEWGDSAYAARAAITGAQVAWDAVGDTACEAEAKAQIQILKDILNET